MQDFHTQSKSDMVSLTQKQYALSSIEEKNLITYNHITYGLYLLSFLMMGVLCIVPIIMNYSKRHDAKHSWLATHFDWQIKTFWYSLLISLCGTFLLVLSLGGVGVSVLAESNSMVFGSFGMMLLGGLLLFVSVVWYLYRIVRGWIALSDKRPVP